MRASQVLGTFVVAIVAALAAPAHADGVLQISAGLPVGGLPALSKDGAAFARPVRVQPAGCGGTQIFVELGTVGSPTRDAAGELILVKDECTSTAASVIEKNLARVNEALRGKQMATVKGSGPMQLPASLPLGGRRISVQSAGKANATIAVEGSQTDRWAFTLDGPVIEVRNAYEAAGPDGKRYVSVLLATRAKDTGDAGRERWVDVWPIGGGDTTVAKGSPADVGNRWIAAMVAKDSGAIARMISVPFWKVGLKPVAGKPARTCRRLDKVRRQKSVPGIARCIAAGASKLYAQHTARPDAVVEIDRKEFPEELRKHEKKVMKLVDKGARLVRFSVNDEGLYVHLVLVLDPATDHQTALAALEFIEVEAGAENE